MSDIPKRGLQQRRSACADSALRAEIDRVGKMTIEERVKAALSLRDRFHSIIQPPEPKQP